MVAAIGASHIRDIFDVAAALSVDLAALVSQPSTWDGIANPFLLLPHQHRRRHARAAAASIRAARHDRGV